jgi:DNA-binding MarR family transcriptional regulator
MSADGEVLAKQLGALRRAMLREGLLAAVSAMDDLDLSLPQIAALLLLDDLGDQTSSAIAGYLGRSASATSRLLDQLVTRGLIARREDGQDRRFKRVAIQSKGKDFLAGFELRRAEAQLGVMAKLSSDERLQVMHAMQLLANAAKRSES